MNLIKYLILLLKFGEILCSNENVNINDCGQTPMYSRDEIAGGKVIEPDEFSWLASLQYGRGNTYGGCGGSVINEWYVLTAAHCVTGTSVNFLGGLTGVRLGDFSESPYCDYGSSNCSLYLYFGIRNTIVHGDYRIASNFVPHNDIALLRLIRRIPFDNVLKPVCLPNINVSEPKSNTVLTVAGWGRTENQNDSAAKRAAFIPLLTDPKICEFQDESKICAGVLSSNPQNASSSCTGDSGGPLMYQFERRQMMIEGIVSFVSGGNCVNEYYPTHYTRVRYYLNWIHQNIANSISITTTSTTTTTTTTARTPTTTTTSIVDRKFPTDARWYFSETEKRCLLFYYTGFGGNKNGFPSLESCETQYPRQVAKDICDLPIEAGQCDSYYIAWYYDTKDTVCHRFYYSGCGGNQNRFASELECNARCRMKLAPRK